MPSRNAHTVRESRPHLNAAAESRTLTATAPRPTHPPAVDLPAAAAADLPAPPVTAAAGSLDRDRGPLPGADADVHVLRLCLDLQLDAMLLILGAAAGAPADDGPDAPGPTAATPPTATPAAATPAAATPEDSARTPSAVGAGPGAVAATTTPPSATPPIPWNRWLHEDVEATRQLAADVLTGGAALPATLGLTQRRTVPPPRLEQLIARYQAIRELLGGIADPVPVTGSGSGSGPPGAGTGPVRPDGDLSRNAERALQHCRQRLAELHRMVPEAPPARRATDPRKRHYLPGELLG